MLRFNFLGSGPVEEFVQEALKAGLPPQRDAAFLLWVGNEVWEKRELDNFELLKARAQALVKMFLAQDRVAREG